MTRMAGDQLQAALTNPVALTKEAVEALDQVRSKIPELNGIEAGVSMEEIVAVSPRLREGPPVAVVDGRQVTMNEIKFRYEMGDYVVDGGDPSRGGAGAFWATNIQGRPPYQPNSPIPQYALIQSP